QVLPAADRPLPLARRGGVGAAAGVFEEAGHVIAVQNRKIRLHPQDRAVLAQHAHAQRMEGADQRLLRGAADQALGALAHLGCRLVGEGDGGDAPGFQSRLDQARDLVRDHARLAGAGAGQHEARPLHVVDSFLRGEVEAGRHGRKEGGKYCEGSGESYRPVKRETQIRGATVARRIRRCLTSCWLPSPSSPWCCAATSRRAVACCHSTRFRGSTPSCSTSPCRPCCIASARAPRSPSCWMPLRSSCTWCARLCWWPSSSGPAAMRASAGTTPRSVPWWRHSRTPASWACRCWWRCWARRPPGRPSSPS